MAKKRLTDVPAAKAVRQHLASKRFDLAAEEARKLSGFAPGASTTDLLREALFGLAGAYADRKQFADFNRVTTELEPLCLAAGAEAIVALGRLYLRGLKPGEVMRLIGLLSDPADTAALRGELADHVVRTRNGGALPDEWRSTFDAFQTALTHYEAKRDDDAREALSAVGLGSPFLEWKLWLRGLLAWSASDDGRALENWGRLNPARLPHRLAAPLRAQADPSWLADQPALREQLLKQYQRLGSGALAGQLRQLRPELAGRKGLGKAFQIAEGLLPKLKAARPALVPHLANVFYHAMLKRGEPGDLDRFTKVFGRMPDDPHFLKLSAQIYDAIDEPEQALSRWAAYVGWLGDEAPWPPILKRQAVAIVYRTMAALAAQIEPGDAPPASKGKKAGPPAPAPSALLTKALEAMPDWDEAAADLMKAYLGEDQAPAACAFAEAFLGRNPNAAAVSQLFAEVLMRSGRFPDALRQLDRLRKTNPFDAAVRRTTAECVLHCAYDLARDAEPAAPLALLAEHKDILQGEAPVMAGHLRFALYRKLKRAADAEADFKPLDPANLLQAFLLATNSQLLKAKPAEKSAAGRTYKAALAANASAAEALALFRGYRFFMARDHDFTGRKAMLKGIADAMLASSADPALTEDQGAELIAHLGPLATIPKMEKLADALARRFPKHPLFPLCVAELWAAKNPTRRAPLKIMKLLRRAKDLARHSADPRHQLLEDRIDELLESFDPFADIRTMFDSFF